MIMGTDSGSGSSSTLSYAEPKLPQPLMHHALAMTDILIRIFNYTHQRETARSARVCKLWSDVALDRLWRHVLHIPHLFELLAPIHTERSLMKTFIRELEVEDWIRYYEYANRVRHLSIRESMVFMTRLFADVARTRQTLCLTPNLLHLDILCEPQVMRNAIMFLHPGLTHLTITLSPVLQADENSWKDHFRRFFSEVLFRAPNVTDLHIKFREPLDIIPFECVLVDLFQGLRSLENLIIPRWTLTPYIFGSLSDHPNIKSIQNQLYPKEISGTTDDIPGLNLHLGKNSFSSLHTLYFQTGFPQANFLFQGDFAPVNITELYLELLRQDFEEDGHLDFMYGLAKNCSSLTHLTLNVKDGYGDWSAFAFTDLQPLFKFRALRSFTFIHSAALQITDEEIVRLVKSFPTLETLILNPEPQVCLETKLSFDVLDTIAAHCPNIHTLGLYVDARTYPFSNCTVSRFKNLRALSFGHSPISHPKDIALHLSRLCPSFTTPVLRLSPYDEGPQDGVSDELLQHRMVWSYVIEILPLFLRAREEERRQARALQREIEELRRRLESACPSADLAH